ncbi:MAG TPA: polysaccharide deacetylase family protein [Candidatus Nitrosotalea sp.]|nr:polysaccharide deacetylase family protein [Candidatus Nitrosotalea sp.]
MNLLGIDFEEWYHPELIQRRLTTKDNKPSIINGIDKILEWLNKNETYATFFIVGDLLELKPELLDKILSNGHEIGFHTMHHTRLDSPNFKDVFLQELKHFDTLTSGKSRGFRAPTFSLNNSSAWAIDILAENGYQYDSSVVPAKTNLYGIPNAGKKPYKITSNSLEKDSQEGKLIEFPLLTTKILGKNVPACGGFYLRALPSKIIENAIDSNNQMDIPSSFYIHSWELTPEYMPKISMPLIDNFVTYHNLKGCMNKMDRLLKKFKFTSFGRYLSKNYTS